MPIFFRKLLSFDAFLNYIGIFFLGIIQVKPIPALLKQLLHIGGIAVPPGVERRSCRRLRRSSLPPWHHPGEERPGKKYGVQTAETIWQARKKCPNLILLPPHHERYHEYSRKVNAIYDGYTDLVEPFGIDESWLDVTHTLHLFGGDAKALADTLRSRVKRELGLTLSVGVSFNKVFAKLGGDYKKPDATTVISPENWREIVWPLPAGAMLFVGGADQKILRKYGMETIGQVAACKLETLETVMGKLGTQIYEYANGLDESPVKSRYETEPVKSVGNGTTFSCQRQFEIVRKRRRNFVVFRRGG